MAALGSLVANLVLQYAQYTQGLDAAQQQALGAAKRIQDGVDKMSDSMRGGIASMAKGAAAAAAAYFSVQAGIQGVTSAIDRMDAVSDRVQKLGVGAEALQALSYYAEFSSMTIEGLDTGLRTLSKGMEGVREGSKEQVSLFKAIGVQVVDTNGKMRSTEDVFRDLAEKFSGYEDGASKTALAIKVFGKAGADMLPMLNAGADGIDEATKKAKALGLVMSGETVEGAAQFNDAMDDLGRVVQGTFNRFAESVLPLLTRFAQLVVTGATEVGELGVKTGALGSDKSMPNWIEATLLGLGAVADVVVLVGKLFDVITAGFKMAVANVNLAVATAMRAKAAIAGVFGDGATEEEKAAFDTAVSDASNALKNLGASLKEVVVFDGSYWMNKARQAIVDVRNGVGKATEEANKPTKPTKPPPIVPSTGGTSKADALDYSGAIQAIELAAKAESEALARMVKENDAAYAAGLKSAFAYYDEKYRLSTNGALAQIKASEDEMSVIQAQLASGKGSLAERKKLAEQEQKLAANISRAYVNLLGVQKDVDTERADYSTKLLRGWAADAEKSADAAETQSQALRDQINQYGMSKGAIADMVAVRAREDAAMARTGLAMAIMRGDRQEDIKAIMDEVAALERRADTLAGVASDTYELERLEKNKEFAEEAKRQNEQIGESLTDALLRGFEDGKGFAQNFKTTMVNLFKTMVLKPIIQPIAQGAANYVTGALGLTDNTGSSSFFDQAGNAKNLIGTGLSSISKYYGGAAASSNVVGGAAASEIGSLVGGASALGGAATAFSAGATAVGSHVVGGVAANAIGGLVGGGGGVAAGGLGASLGGAMSAIGAAMPYIGAAIAIYTLLSGSFKGEKRSGGTFGWADGQSQFLHGPSGGTAGQDGVVNAAIGATAGGVNSLLKAAGSALSVNSLIAGFEGSEKGRGGVMSGVTLSDGRKIGEDGTGSNYKGTYYNKALPTTLTTEVAAGLLVTDLKQLQIEVLQSADDIPSALRKLVDGVDAVSLSDDAATSLLGQISAQVAAVEGFRNMVEGAGAPLAKFKDLSYDLTTAFVEASGGLDAAQGNLASFYETYRSEDVRMADTLSAMTAVFKDLDLAVPATKDEFAALVDGLSLTDEATVKARAKLLSINQLFAGWADYAETKAKEVTETAKQTATAQATAWASFLDVVLSDDQKAARQAEQVKKTFTDLGVALPASLDGLHEMVEALDPNIESQRTLRDALMAAAPAFSVFIKGVDGTAKAIKDAADADKLRLKGLEDTFVDQYHTDDEKNAAEGWRLFEAFNALGVTMPATTQQLRAMIDAGGDSRKGLLELSSSFYKFSASMAQANTTAVSATLALLQATTGAGAVDTATQLGNTALTVLQASITNQKRLADQAFEAQSTLLKTQISAAQAGVAQWQRVNERAKSTLATLLGQFDAVGQRRDAQALIGRAAQTGVIGDPVALENALGLVAQPTEELFGSFSDYQLDFLRTANDVAKLNSLTGNQLSIEQRSLDALTEQLTQAEEQHRQTIERLDDQLTTAQRQLESQLGTAPKIMELPDALKEVANALKAIAEAQKGTTPAGQVNAWYDKVLGRKPDEAGGAYWQGQIDKNGVPAAQQEFSAAAQSEIWLGNLYKTLGKTLDAGGRDFWVQALTWKSRAEVEAEIRRLSAVDGSHAAGLDYVPFDGYVAELHLGERVQTAAEARADDAAEMQPVTAPAMVRSATTDMREVVAELQELKGKLARIEKNTGGTEKNTLKTADLVDRVTEGGNAMLTEALA